MDFASQDYAFSKVNLGLFKVTEGGLKRGFERSPGCFVDSDGSVLSASVCFPNPEISDAWMTALEEEIFLWKLIRVIEMQGERVGSGHVAAERVSQEPGD